MQTTTTNKPSPQNVTPQAERILDFLREIDGWATRKYLAKQLQKKRLNKWDVGLLEMLEENGLIEALKREDSTAIGWHWEYRIPDD